MDDARDPRREEPATEPAGLNALAERIADGLPVDWGAALREHPEQAELLTGLRLLERLEQLGRGAAEPEREGAGAPEDGSSAEARELFLWGHLRVRRRLGHGTFGEVFLAFEPILRREVALKLRRTEELPGTSPRQFIDEARRLARVRHPNVLAVHGADVHDGRAGLWADLVPGETLEASLTTGGRLAASEALRITRTLAEALTAVHDADLVHGDLKAANVMLDDTGRVVLMDFSAASDLRIAGGPARAASPLTTAPEGLLGSPPGPAADFYSLGALLFRMLTGEHPVAAKTLKELMAFHGEHSRTRRRWRGAPLTRALGRLAEDLLAADPAARPDGAEVLSRLRSMEEAPARRRRRRLVTAVIVSLAVGIAASTAGYLDARRSARSERAARVETQAVNEFLESVLSAPRVSALGPRAQLSDLLDGAAARAEHELAQLPDVAARVFSWLADTQTSIDDQEKAETLFHRGLDAWDRSSARDPRLHVELRSGLGLVYCNTERYDEAVSLLSEVITEADRLAPENRWRLVARVYRARALEGQGNLQSAMTDLEAALALRRSGADEDDLDLHLARIEMADLLREQSDFAKAEVLLRSELAFWLESQTANQYKPLVLRHNLAALLNRVGRPAEAEPLLRRNLEVADRWLGDGSRPAFSSLILLEDSLWLQGRRESSLALSREILQQAERNYGPTSIEYLTVLGNYGVRLDGSGQRAEAESVLRRSGDLAAAVLPPGNSTQFLFRFNLAEMLYRSGRVREALEIVGPDRAVLAETFGRDHLLTIVDDTLAGACQVALGRRHDGEALLEQTLKRAREALGPDQPNTLETQIYLARALHTAGRDGEALPLLADAVERRRRALGGEHPSTLEAASELAGWRR